MINIFKRRDRNSHDHDQENKEKVQGFMDRIVNALFNMLCLVLTITILAYLIAEAPNKDFVAKLEGKLETLEKEYKEIKEFLEKNQNELPKAHSNDKLKKIIEATKPRNPYKEKLRNLYANKLNTHQGAYIDDKGNVLGENGEILFTKESLEEEARKSTKEALEEEAKENIAPAIAPAQPKMAEDSKEDKEKK